MLEAPHHAIRETLSALTRAWDEGDATAYARLFTADATYVVFNGHVLRGRDEIEEVHRALLDGPLRGSRLGDAATAPQQPAEIRLLRPDVAAVLVNGGVRAGEDQPLTPDRASVVSLTMVEDAGEWRVAAFQNTRLTTGKPS